MARSSISKPVQYALISWLARDLGGPDRGLGKKALQKIVHLIQELGSVDAGYNFSFYTYGPYSSELASDLDLVQALGGVDVIYNSDENYYIISKGKFADSMIKRGEDFVFKNKKSIDIIVKTFGKRLAKNLELVSTIVYLRRHVSQKDFEDNSKLSAHVKALKPKYSDVEIERAIDEVRAFLDAMKNN